MNFKPEMAVFFWSETNQHVRFGSNFEKVQNNVEKITSSTLKIKYAPGAQRPDSPRGGCVGWQCIFLSAICGISSCVNSNQAEDNGSKYYRILNTGCCLATKNRPFQLQEIGLDCASWVCLTTSLTKKFPQI
jgi:hypothetical protein